MRIPFGLVVAFCAVAAAPGAWAQQEGDPESYKFNGGEKIQLRFQPSSVGEVFEQTVSYDGFISLPTGTPFKIRGLTLTKAQSDIATVVQTETKAVKVQVRILILDYPPRKIYIAGEVRTPKSITLTPGVPLTLLGALQEAGGISEQGDPTHVNVVHGEAAKSYDVTSLGQPDKNKPGQPGSANLGPHLEAGDTIVVPRGDHFVFTGEFIKTGIVSIGDLHMTADEKPLLARVIAGIGGFKKEADMKKIRISRLNRKDGTRHDVVLDKAQDILAVTLEDGDIVEVPAKPEVPPKKENPQIPSVSISGKVRTPGMYPISENGLKLSKLVLMAGGLSETAKGNKVTLNRASDNGILRTIDVNAILKKGQWSLDVDLMDGDVINVPERAF